MHALCRNQERGEAAVRAIKEKSGNQSVFLEVVDQGIHSIVAFETPAVHGEISCTEVG